MPLGIPPRGRDSSRREIRIGTELLLQQDTHSHHRTAHVLFARPYPPGLGVEHYLRRALIRACADDPQRLRLRMSIDIRIKRAYDAVAPSDGHRVLVDAMWPRGLAKDRARIDTWLREVAPTRALRQWFGHQPSRWAEFRRRYHRQLQARQRTEAVEWLRSLARSGRVTLIYAASDKDHNNAVALKQYLDATETHRHDG